MDCQKGDYYDNFSRSKEEPTCCHNPSKCSNYRRFSISDGEATQTEAYAPCNEYPNCTGSKINGLTPICQRTFCPAPDDDEPQKCPHCHRPLMVVDPAWQGTHLQCTGCRRGWQRDSKGYYFATGCAEMIIADPNGEVIWEGQFE